MDAIQAAWARAFGWKPEDIDRVDTSKLARVQIRTSCRSSIADADTRGSDGSPSATNTNPSGAKCTSDGLASTSR